MKKPRKLKVDKPIDYADREPQQDAERQPLPEEDQGSGDIYSPERQAPTDDDTPLG